MLVKTIKYKRKNKIKKNYYFNREEVYISSYSNRIFKCKNNRINRIVNARFIKTFNERKAYDDALEQNVKIRGKRSKRMIPSNWDDIKASAYFERKSWKRNSKRKHQWKYE